MGDGGKNGPAAFPGKIGKTIKKSTPHWPAGPKPPAGAPNILIVLFDDVGFSDFGCYGSPIATPAIDRIAAQGLRYTGFHTTAMCSTTRAALLQRHEPSFGRHGLPCQLRQRLSRLPRQDRARGGHAGRDAAPSRLPQLHGRQVARHACVRDGTDQACDGWPLARGFSRYYGFMDAETDQYSPELVLDNTHIDASGTFEKTGYHLASTFIDE